MSTGPDLEMTKHWDRLMRLQVDYILPLEVVFFYASKDWSTARHVLDLGTGNGYFLGRLAELFPSKHYTGLDANSDYISIAQREVDKSLGIKFGVRSAYDLDPCQDGTYDFVIARALVQHLDDSDRFLNQVREILNPCGSLLIVDADDPARMFVPDVPLLTSLFQKIRAASRARGHSRDAAGLMCKGAGNHGFQKTYEKQLIVPTTIPGHEELCYHVYLKILDVLPIDYNLEFDYRLLRKELQNWLDTPNSYAQTGVSMACYQRAE